MGPILKRSRRTLGLACAFGLLAADAANADGPTTEQLLSLIQQQQTQLDELKAALDAARRQTEKTAAKAEMTEKSVRANKILSSLDLGGVIEVEATDTGAFSGADTSDVTLAKIEVYLDAQPMEALATHVQLLYEDDGNDNITLDEAYATLGRTEAVPAYLQAGKWAVPFGGFDTNMSTDPLTQTLGETKEAAILVGYETSGFDAGAYVYNGDSQKSGESDRLDQYGLFAGYGGKIGGGAIDVGIGYISNVADSDGLTNGLGGNATALGGYVAGIEGHAAVSYGNAILRGAYLTAVEPFRAGELAFNGQGAEPAAWHVEAAYTLPILTRDTTLAVTAQGTREALALALPETRLGGAVTINVVEHCAVTAEYLHDKDYATSDGGTGNTGHTATLKLAVDF